MAVEDELSNFRTAWKQELSTTASQSKEEKARALYKEGMKLEREGYCYEAMEYYRRALQLVPDLDQQIDIETTSEIAETQAESSSQFLDFQQVIIIT